MNFSLNTRVVRSPEPISASTGDELVMFSVEKGKYYGFDAIATEIWHHMEFPITVASICAELEDMFDVTPMQCEADVKEFLAKLQERDMVRIVG